MENKNELLSLYLGVDKAKCKSKFHLTNNMLKAWYNYGTIKTLKKKEGV